MGKTRKKNKNKGGSRKSDISNILSKKFPEQGVKDYSELADYIAKLTIDIEEKEKLKKLLIIGIKITVYKKIYNFLISMRDLEILFRNKPIFNSIFEKLNKMYRDKEIVIMHDYDDEINEFDKILQKFTLDELKKILRILSAYSQGEIGQIKRVGQNIEEDEEFNRWYNINYPNSDTRGKGKTYRKRYKQLNKLVKKKSKKRAKNPKK